MDTVEDLEAQVAALQQKVQAARAEKARLAAEAEEKRLEEERLREEEKKKEAEETRKRLAAAAAAKASSSRSSVSDCFVVRWVFCLTDIGLYWAPGWRPPLSALLGQKAGLRLLGCVNQGAGEWICISGYASY
jgi:regulator of replication initiation timing